MAETRRAHLGRLNFLSIFDDVQHSLGDAMETVGQVPMVGDPRPSPFTVSFPIYPGSGEAQTEAQRLRRQVVGLLGNRAARAYLWFGFDIDTEISAWLAVGGAEIAEVDGGTTFSRWKLTLTDAFVIGRPQAYRPAKRLYATDLRAGTAARDYLGTQFSTAFVGLSALALHYLPFDATDVIGASRAFITQGAASGAQPAVASRITKAGNIPILVGRPDQEVVSYEQPVASRHNASDVVLYDRQGLGVASKPTTGPDSAWEEVYGPNQPLTAGDVPVMDNGVCRVRYHTTGGAVFAVDLWAGGAWVDQGTAFFRRVGDTPGVLDTLVAVSVAEWTPERAVLRLVLRLAADALAREVVVITLQRGWTGPRFEYYAASKANGTASGARVYFQTAFSEQQTLLKLETGGFANISSASAFPGATFGASTFNSENWVALLRAGTGVYSPSLAVVQSTVQAYSDSNSSYGYGTRNIFGVNAGPYISGRLSFTQQDPNLGQEAESMTLGSGTSSTADGAASGGTTTTSTRTADAIHVSKPNWLTAVGGISTVRVLARVKTTASTLNIYAKTTTTTGATKTTTSTSYVWLDLGDITCASGTQTLEIHAWATAAATISVDRVEALPMERRAGVVTYDGIRDQAQASLYAAGQAQAIQER